MRKSKYTADVLSPICAANKSFAGVIKSLGLKLTGGNYRYIQKRIRALELDTSHFTGQGWTAGETKDTHASIGRMVDKTSYTREEVFTKQSAVSGKVVRALYKREAVDYKCSILECGLTSWLGQKITLHLDHVDGDPTNNTLSNLRWLCPNCHQQTETWGGSNRRKYNHGDVVELVDTQDLTDIGFRGSIPQSVTKTPAP